MTAQIAMMNKNAVALATDSAVTMSNPRGVKVHNSANKLFTLSKFQPVGIMVHANADFMGYPWETLIKAYRSVLGEAVFATVKEYADDFFQFLFTRDTLFSTERQESWFRVEAEIFASSLNGEFVNRVRKFFEETGQQLDEATANNLFEEFLADNERLFAGRKSLPCYDSKDMRDAFELTAGPIADEAIEKSFQDWPIDVFKARLRSVIITRFVSGSGNGYSGLVFAGFGEAEFLPVVQSFWTDGIFAGQVRRVKYDDLSGDMNQNDPVSIYPFAQSDSVYRFLQGIDPAYKRNVENYLKAMTDEICDHVNTAAAVTALPDEDRELANISLVQAVADSRGRLDEKLSRMERGKFLSPVMDVIASLPKEDLAAIAESLVNLTSFQRKILQEAETVGGPIDVAVISKGDGFIWIKRKHYFEKDLNPAFFANYYRRSDDADRA